MSWFMRWEQFMRTDLGLKGSELYIYAVIYGFTKSKGNFSGSLKYLEEVTGFTAVQCCNTLKSLVEKGLIEKKSIQNKKGFLKSEYTAVPIDELTLPEKQEKPKRKTKQKTAAKPSNLTINCETQGDLYQGIGNTEKPQENAENGGFQLSGDIVDKKPKPPKIRQPESEVLTPIQMVWQAYKQAYLQRYGIEPLRNAKIFGQIKNFIAMVGEKDAPHIAAYYVTHNRALYVQKAHDIGTLLMNAQVITKDYYTGYQTTGITAKWAEETETARTAAEQAKILIRQSHFEKQQKTA